MEEPLQQQYETQRAMDHEAPEEPVKPIIVLDPTNPST